MTVRVERAFEFEAPPEQVWEFIADPGRRAGTISVVERWEQEGDETVWHLSLPIPFVDQTVAVRTRDVEVDPGERVRFEGRSRVMNVQGEHELEAIDGGTRLLNRFAVDGRIPGVERFFERNLDDELENLRTALLRELGLEA
ncbi:MAG: CoxG family protein [Halobacteriales archaeon]